MAVTMDGGVKRGVNGWRLAGWGSAAGLLLLPAVAMQFTREVDWDETDFIVMGVMLGAVGLGIEFLVRQSDSVAYRLGAALAVLAAFLLVWANLAVGMIGSEDNPANLLFGGVIAIAGVGAVLARFRAGGMARAMTAAWAAQAAIGAWGLSVDVRGGRFTMVLSVFWLLAAALFAYAARRRAVRPD